MAARSATRGPLRGWQDRSDVLLYWLVFKVNDLNVNSL